MRKLINVPYINQMPDYPTGCETISTIMYLRYLGIDVVIEDFIDNYLPKRNFEVVDGVTYGPNPNEVFVGSPYDSNSYGCFPKVMVKALKDFFEAKKLPYEAFDLTGKPTEELLKEYIDKDIPVLYWTCIDMKPSHTGPSWILFDTNEKYTWTNNEHCLLLTGYDDNNLITNDPWNGNGVIAYDKETCIARHIEQFEGAVVIKKVI